LSDSGRVLDIGCGTGAFLFCLSENGYQAVGVDFSPSMLRAAKKSTVGKSIELVQGDVTQGLDFPDKSFDLVLASYFFMVLVPAYDNNSMQRPAGFLMAGF